MLFMKEWCLPMAWSAKGVDIDRVGWGGERAISGNESSELFRVP